MSIDAKLEQLVEQEAWEIAQAPPVPRGPLHVRCHFCGQLAASVTLVERLGLNGEHERWRGDCCTPIAQQEVRWIPKTSA